MHLEGIIIRMISVAANIFIKLIDEKYSKANGENDAIDDRRFKFII